ncbi:MAG: response regulator [Acidimicrobiia bacterium]
MTYRVLVVEDDTDISLAIELNLRLDGFQVRIENDGRRALDSVLEFDPHCVIVDVVMPGRSGYEVCRDVREHPECSKLPVLMLTAKSLPADREAGLAAGANAFMVKPFEPEDLVAHVIALVEPGSASK